MLLTGVTLRHHFYEIPFYWLLTKLEYCKLTFGPARSDSHLHTFNAQALCFISRIRLCTVYERTFDAWLFKEPATCISDMQSIIRWEKGFG